MGSGIFSPGTDTLFLEPLWYSVKSKHPHLPAAGRAGSPLPAERNDRETRANGTLSRALGRRTAAKGLAALPTNMQKNDLYVVLVRVGEAHPSLGRALRASRSPPAPSPPPADGGAPSSSPALPPHLLPPPSSLRASAPPREHFSLSFRPLCGRTASRLSPPARLLRHSSSAVVAARRVGEVL